jgi:predicted transcriptional regulator
LERRPVKGKGRGKQKVEIKTIDDNKNKDHTRIAKDGTKLFQKVSEEEKEYRRVHVLLGLLEGKPYSKIVEPLNFSVIVAAIVKKELISNGYMIEDAAGFVITKKGEQLLIKHGFEYSKTECKKIEEGLPSVKTNEEEGLPSVKTNEEEILALVKQNRIPIGCHQSISDNRKWEPTDDDRRKVMLMIATGVPPEELARIIDPKGSMALARFKRLFKKEIVDGKNIMAMEALDTGYKYFNGELRIPNSGGALIVHWIKAIGGAKDIYVKKEEESQNTAEIMRQTALQMANTIPKPKKEEVGQKEVVH